MNHNELSQDAPPQLARMVNADTPQGVYVPSQWTGIILWALGRFGIGIVFVYAAWMIYQDNKALTERVIKSNERWAEVQANTVQAMQSLKSAVDMNSAEIRAIQSQQYHYYKNNDPR